MCRADLIAIAVLFALWGGCGQRTVVKTSEVEVATSAPAAVATSQQVAAVDNAELVVMYNDDQLDRQGGGSDWKAAAERDEQRERRVRDLVAVGALQTGMDYHRAALIMQHSADVEGIELAHELAMIAVAMGDSSARWLAAASYDRLLTRLGRGQRFGTQSVSSGAGEAMHLAPVEAGVTDEMRRRMNCPAMGSG